MRLYAVITALRTRYNYDFVTTVKFFGISIIVCFVGSSEESRFKVSFHLLLSLIGLCVFWFISIIDLCLVPSDSINMGKKMSPAYGKATVRIMRNMFGNGECEIIWESNAL
jgi:hypothetical protein